MDKKVTLNMKEQKRLRVLNEVEAGRLTGKQAAELLGLSVRQVRRLIASYREKGAAHGRTFGRAGPRQSRPNLKTAHT
jgi:transposase